MYDVLQPRLLSTIWFNASTITLSEWYSVVHPQDRIQLEERVNDHVIHEGRVTTQYRARKTNGQYVWILGTAVTKEHDGETFMVGSHRDISDQKLMESYLNQAAFMTMFRAWRTQPNSLKTLTR